MCAALSRCSSGYGPRAACSLCRRVSGLCGKGRYGRLFAPEEVLPTTAGSDNGPGSQSHRPCLFPLSGHGSTTVTTRHCSPGSQNLILKILRLAEESHAHQVLHGSSRRRPLENVHSCTAPRAHQVGSPDGNPSLGEFTARTASFALQFQVYLSIYTVKYFGRACNRKVVMVYAPRRCVPLRDRGIEPPNYHAYEVTTTHVSPCPSSALRGFASETEYEERTMRNHWGVDSSPPQAPPYVPRSDTALFNGLSSEDTKKEIYGHSSGDHSGSAGLRAGNCGSPASVAVRSRIGSL